MKDQLVPEERIVYKVEELMETLDNVKRYNVFTNSLKKFSVVLLSSFVVSFILRGLVDFLDLGSTQGRPVFLSILFLLILIPLVGIAAGVIFVRNRVNSVKTGEWKEDLSNGFPSALKILLELGWDKTIDEISMGRISYFIYGLLKIVACWVAIFFALGFVGTALVLIYHLGVPFFAGPFLGLLSFLIVILTLHNDFLKRYKEMRSLDMLLWELRWFSLELRRADFQT